MMPWIIGLSARPLAKDNFNLFPASPPGILLPSKYTPSFCTSISMYSSCAACLDPVSLTISRSCLTTFPPILMLNTRSPGFLKYIYVIIDLPLRILGWVWLCQLWLGVCKPSHRRCAFHTCIFSSRRCICMDWGVLDISLFGLLVGLIVHIDGLATHKGIIGFVLEGFIDGLNLLILGAAV